MFYVLIYLVHNFNQQHRLCLLAVSDASKHDDLKCMELINWASLEAEFTQSHCGWSEEQGGGGVFVLVTAVLRVCMVQPGCLSDEHNSEH